MKKKQEEKKNDENIIEFLSKKYKLPQLKEDIVEIKKFTDISNLRNYEEDLEQLPSIMNIFGILVAKAMKAMHKAETNYKVWRAIRNKELREGYDRKKIKYTESKIENEIVADSEYRIMKNRLYKSEEEYEILKSCYWSIQKKSEVLIEASRQRSNNAKLDNARIEQRTKY